MMKNNYMPLWFPILVLIQFYMFSYRHLGVAETSQIFLRDVHVLTKLLSYEEHCRCRSISSESAVNPLVAFYDIHGRKGEVLFALSRTPQVTRTFKMPYIY
jgi:hypothetical protein